MASVVGIAEDTLDFIIELARDSEPEGFVAYLQATDARELGVDIEGEILTELVFSPPSRSGGVFNVLGIDTLPRGSIVGSVRSKPDGEAHELDEDDYERFSDLGSRHIIITPPYDRGSWVCYSPSADEVPLELFDVEFEDDDFEF